MRVMAPSPNAPPAPQITLMPQAAAIVPTAAPAMPRIGDRRRMGLIGASTRPAASTMKQNAAAGDIRDDRSDAAANNAATTELINVSRGRCNAVPNKARPLSKKTTAVAPLIGGRPGAIRTRTLEWTVHPVSTTKASRIDRAPHTAAVILEKDLGLEKDLRLEKGMLAPLPGIGGAGGRRALPNRNPCGK